MGGSIISLFKLVECLNKKLYEPFVLLYGSPSYYNSRFEEVGAKVITPDRRFTVKRNKWEEIRLGNSLEHYNLASAQIYRLLKAGYRLLRGDLVRAWRLKQIISKNQIDLVHHNQWGQDNVLAAWLTGVPQICHIRALGKMGPLDHWLARSVDTFIYVSQALASHYEDQGIPTRKGRVIWNGVIAEEFNPDQETETLRQELGLHPTDVVIGSVGRLVEWKGYEFFLSAMAELAPAFPKLKVLIVGEADQTPQSQAYKESLKALTHSLGLSERVIFTGFRQDIPRIMASLKVLVHSSTELEPFGRVLIEAMAAGTPVVASEAGGIWDVAEDGTHALLVPPKNAQAIAEAIRRILTDSSLAERLSQAGRNRVLESCTVEQYTNAVQNIYRNILRLTDSKSLKEPHLHGIS